LLSDDSALRVDDSIDGVVSPSASEDFDYAETIKLYTDKAIKYIEDKEAASHAVAVLKRLHDFWEIPKWSLELAQDMGDVHMQSDEGLQQRLWAVWESIQRTHLLYIEYLKTRSEFWFKLVPSLEASRDGTETAFVKDLTTEGIEPDPGPPKSASGFKKSKGGVRARPSKISGKGDYDIGKHFSSGTRNKIKDWVSRGGAKLGEMAGSAISKIFGFGDYTVSKNSLLNGAPVFGSKRAERISRRVYIGEVLSSVVFTTQYYIALNPAMGQFDPQLRLESWNYEEYDINGMIFYFRSLSATAVASTNTALGAIMMATNYDANADQFTSKLAMENHLFSTSAAPCNDSIHAVECDRKQSVLSRLYLRHTDHQKVFKTTQHGLGTADLGNLPPIIDDFHTYDFGDFQLSTQGSQAIASVGELWCSYDVTLYKHKLLSSPATVEYMGLSLVGNGMLMGPVSDLFSTSKNVFLANSSLDFRSTIVPKYVDLNSINLGRLPPGCYFVHLDLNWANASAGGAFIWPSISSTPSVGDLSGPVRSNHLFLAGTQGNRAAPQSSLDGVVTAMAVFSFTIIPDVPWSAWPTGLNLNFLYNMGNGGAVASSGSITLVGFSDVGNP
jgi:hypothetical protein